MRRQHDGRSESLFLNFEQLHQEGICDKNHYFAKFLAKTITNSICLFVCKFVCLQHNSESTSLMAMKCFREHLICYQEEPVQIWSRSGQYPWFWIFQICRYRNQWDIIYLMACKHIKGSETEWVIYLVDFAKFLNWKICTPSFSS